MKNSNKQPNYSQPVAYDTQGRPLYLHPPEAVQQNVPQAHPPIVHMARPIDPAPLAISDETRRKHELSRQKYPSLNLSEGEYVISAIRRHPFGMVPIMAVVAVGILGVSTLAGMYVNYAAANSTAPGLLPANAVTILALLVALLFAVGGFIAVHIYNANRFYLTNESVVQEIQHGLFSKHEQTVSLGNIEDASYRQENFIASMLNYGSIRLSTEGDETTYRFSYVSNPKKHIAVLNNAVEAFKNGRPVSEYDT